MTSDDFRQDFDINLLGAVNLRLIDATDKDKLQQFRGKTIGPINVEIEKDQNGYIRSRELMNPYHIRSI